MWVCVTLLGIGLHARFTYRPKHTYTHYTTHTHTQCSNVQIVIIIIMKMRLTCVGMVPIHIFIIYNNTIIITKTGSAILVVN